MQGQAANIASAESGEEAQPSSGIRPDRSNTMGMRLLCIKMRLTLLFIGIIILIFGISLRLTFISDIDNTSCDEKLWESLRMAGSLLLAAGSITICLAVVLIWFALKQQDDFTSSPRQPSSISVAATTRRESNAPTENEQSQQRRSLIRGMIERIRKNWKKQAEWIHAQPRQVPACRRYVTRPIPVEYADSPPNYVDILAVSSSISDVSPPPYDVVI